MKLEFCITYVNGVTGPWHKVPQDGVIDANEYGILPISKIQLRFNEEK